MKILRLVAVAMTVTTDCLRPPLQAGDTGLQLELAALRDVVRQYRPAVLTLDREYVQAGHAPPAGTGQQRSAARQQALVDSLAKETKHPRGDSLRVRTSAPEVEAATARVDVTVDGRLADGRRGAFYETVALVLERVGDRWVVRERRQLGIS